jgi:hypothetical protein
MDEFREYYLYYDNLLNLILTLLGSLQIVKMTFLFICNFYHDKVFNIIVAEKTFNKNFSFKLKHIIKGFSLN